MNDLQTSDLWRIAASTAVLALNTRDRSVIAALRSGAHPATESRAYATGILQDVTGPAQRRAVLRCAAMIATSAAPQEEGVHLGRALGRLAHRFGGTTGERVSLLSRQSGDLALSTLRGLYERMAVERIAVDHAHLVHTMMLWDTRDAASRIRHRNRLLIDVHATSATDYDDTALAEDQKD